MSCNTPNRAYRVENGQVRMGYAGSQVVGPGMQSTPEGRPLELPCGHCAGCRADRKREWAIRCVHEAQLWDSNLFVTLDYDPASECSPESRRSRSLVYRDVQLYLKRLRKRERGVTRGPNGDYPVRFFLSGEYGPSGTRRPHWHALLFNLDFRDKVKLHNGTFRSTLAESYWPHGQTVIGTVTPQSAAYVAGYTQAKMYGGSRHEKEDYYTDRETGEVLRPEFIQMSRDPGIGSWWFDKFRGDLFGLDKNAPRDFAVHDGRKARVPRFYWRKFQEMGDPHIIESIEQARLDRAADIDPSERTAERRAVREEAALRRLSTFSPRKRL